MVHPTRRPSANGKPAAGPSRHATPAPPRRLGILFTALVMVIWVLAFTPEPWALAAVPGIVGWITLVERARTWREVVLWTVLFGAVATGIGYRWLAPTVQLFGGVAVVASWIAVALFGVWNTIHGWIFALFYRGLLRGGRRPHPLITVALFVGCEALPIRMFGWMSGHGAVDVPPLAQAAEWGGVVGVSLVVCLLVIPLHEWLRWAFVRDGVPSRPGAAAVTFLIGVALFGVGLLRYGEVRREEREAQDRLRVAIVQANVGSLDKRRATAEGGTLKERTQKAYRLVTEKALDADPDLVVWPETAITDPVPMKDAQQTFFNLRREGWGFLLEAGKRSALLVGLYESVPGRQSLRTGTRLEKRYNAAALRPAGGPQAPWSLYRKVHLIPFGETMPLGLRQDSLPQRRGPRPFEMIAGEVQQDLLVLGDVTFAPFLCYEGILPEHVREYVDGERPDVLVSLTNDSWFGDTWEPAQHLNFTRLRAIEHRAPLVRATNTGISAFVSATGDVEARLEVGAADVLVRDIPLVARGPTLYVRYGHKLPWLLWAVALLAWLIAQVRVPE